MIPPLAAALFLVQPLVDPGDERLAALDEWLRGLEIDARVPTEIRGYEREGTAAEPEYADAAAEGLRRRLILDAKTALRRELPEGGELIDVSFPGVGVAVGTSDGFDERTREEFEESIVRIEVLAFLPGAVMLPRDALREYTSPDFRKKASSRIERIEDREGLNCVETRGVGGGLVDPMHSCSLVTELHLPELSSQHSQTVSNLDPDQFQAVYFKESLKTFVTVPEGLLFHYINYSRTAGLGSVSKFIGKRKIRGSQETALRELERLLEVPGPE